MIRPSANSWTVFSLTTIAFGARTHIGAGFAADLQAQFEPCSISPATGVPGRTCSGESAYISR